MALDLPRVRALCFDVDGTIADTDDHLVAQLAALVDAVPLVAAGAQTVSVLFGFGTEDELLRTGADLILRTTSDLLAVLHPAKDALGKTASPEPS